MQDASTTFSATEMQLSDVKHSRSSPADSSGLETKHRITHQNYRRGLRSKSAIAEMKIWTEHKSYVLTPEHEEGRRVLLSHLRLPTNLSVLTFAVLLLQLQISENNSDQTITTRLIFG